MSLKNQCELCSSTTNLLSYEIPSSHNSIAEKAITICQECAEQMNKPETMDTNHWRCLNESMWSEVAGVQVLAWRVLNFLKKEHAWAQDLFDQLYLDEPLLSWAESADLAQSDKSDVVTPTKDSHGVLLSEGDSITLIKDLDVKGANFTAKRGTIVKNIRLTDNPEHIEGRVNGTQIVILTCFVKKVAQ